MQPGTLLTQLASTPFAFLQNAAADGSPTTTGGGDGSRFSDAPQPRVRLSSVGSGSLIARPQNAKLDALAAARMAQRIQKTQLDGRFCCRL